MAAPAPRPAATVVLLRPGARGPQVLLLQRAHASAFLGGAYVFPGGAVDAADSDPRVLERVTGLSDAEASARLGLAAGGLAWWVAAIRECFEEAGILVAHRRDGSPVQNDEFDAWRTRPFAELLEAADLTLPADALAYFGHWITAPGRSRRFDARFFLALAPSGQTGRHDAAEIVHQAWLSPQEALDRGARGEIELVFATRQTLQELARFQSPPEAFAHMLSLPEIETNRACWAQGREGPRMFRRGDPQYFEIHWTDPEEAGQTSYDIVPGVPKHLDRWVTRLTAPNPGVMTGPGTNTYLVGEDALAVIDPGPAVASHVEAILEAGKGRIRWILCTHTHLDHSPAAAALKAATGAEVLGRPAPPGQDASFAPDRVPADDEVLQLGDFALRALHTPGHASNHLCFLLDRTRMLFTGDHVMQGSTVVINPPDGDMRAYLGSLERLLGEDLAILAPAHGYLVGEPEKELRRLIAHRLGREQKVIGALRRLGVGTLEELVLLAYDDVSPRLHPVAARSLAAHLDKLLAEGEARVREGRYALTDSAGA